MKPTQTENSGERGRRALAPLLATFALLATTAVAVSGCGSGAESDAGKVLPGIEGGSGGEKNFAYLINNFQQGKPAKQPWAGYWWPYTENGIASARGAGGSSPAGKYDAARGGRTAAQSWEVHNHGPGVKGVQQWWGHCNGWCVASALFDEPHEGDSVKVNGINFGVADVKGLLAEAGMSASADYFGNRVDWPEHYNTPRYTDTVPDQYFLVLTNYMGIGKRGVLIDRYTGDQVWNQPLVGYKFSYPKPEDVIAPDSATPNLWRVNLKSTMYWAEDGVPADIQTPPFNFESDNLHFSERELAMEVWLDGPVEFDANGKITKSGNVIVTRNGDFFVGGAWKMGEGILVDAWPDYMWVPYSMIPTDPTDDYANPHVDINWIKAHLLVPGGADDTSVTARPVEPAPSVRPTPSGSPSSSPTSTTPGPMPTFPSDPHDPRTHDPQPAPGGGGRGGDGPIRQPNRNPIPRPFPAPNVPSGP